MDTKKILTIPDLHGKNVWEKVINPNYDFCVFLGDYCDSFPPTTDEEILTNLNNIISLKKQYPEKVILLWGNHEIHYLLGPQKYECSGFRESMFSKLSQLLQINKFLFHYAFQYKDYIWTHAGIHCGWWKMSYKGNDQENIAEQLNESFRLRITLMADSKTETLLDCGPDRGGIQHIGGPLWLNRNTLIGKGIPGYNQIVGHTAIPTIKSHPNRGKDKGTVTFCDCLDKEEKYHIIEV